jgi:CheY-like chemotaxis protein
MLNLLADANVLALASEARLSPREPRVFTYATDGTRGFVLGMVDLFPPPFDPAACALRVLERSPSAPRVLVVSEAVLGTPELRAHLVRQGCTTSIAFDERQALGLIPSVRPSLALIDLNLPRGEGLRLAARIRADQRNAHVRLAFMWQQNVEPSLFRQLVGRASHDFAWSEDELRRNLLQEFNPGGAAYL